MIVRANESSVSPEFTPEEDINELEEIKTNENDEEFPITVEDVVEISANLACIFRFNILPSITKKEVDKSYEEKFYERYKTIADRVLKIIGFDSALKTVPIKKLPPEYSLWGGVIVLVALAIFIPVGAETKTIKDIVNTSNKETEEIKEEIKNEKVTDEETKEALSALKNLREKVRGGE